MSGWNVKWIRCDVAKYVATFLLLILFYAFFVAQYRHDLAIPENELIISSFALQPDGSYRTIVTETYRTESTSEFSIVIDPQHPPILVNDAVFLTCTMATIARARDFSHFVVLNQTTDDNHGTLLVGFGDDSAQELVDALADDYPSLTAQSVLSVAQFSAVCANYPRYAKVERLNKVKNKLTEDIKTLVGPEMTLFQRWR
jgi:hypothetical protein